MKLFEINKLTPIVTVAGWTAADWDRLWNDPTPELVLTWCHGNNASASYRYMSSKKLSQISVKNGRVNFTSAFEWQATTPRLPFKLGRVGGDFKIYNPHGMLTTTEGFPVKVKGGVNCQYADFATIDEFPQVSPGESVQLGYGALTSLKGLEHLDGVSLYVQSTPLQSLEGIPRRLEYLNASDTAISTISGLHRYLDEISSFFITSPKLKGGLLSLFKIKTTSRVSHLSNPDNDNVGQAFRIISKYIINEKRSNADILKCQQELLDANLDEFAEF